VLVTLISVGIAKPAFGLESKAGTRAAAATAPCASGDAQLTFNNDSGYSNSDVYGTVTLASGTVTPSNLVNNSVPLSNYPVDTNDSTGSSFYVCLAPGVASGRLWISIGAPIVGLPKVQPTVAEPYRFGYIEFTYPGDVDYSNVNDFDFPVNLQTYSSPGASTPVDSSKFSGNTCQIVNAMKTAVDGLGSAADWSSIGKTVNGQFVRIISPSNDLSNNGGWPSMIPYITGLMDSLPLSGGLRGPITVEEYYSPSAGNDVGNQGWFDYHGSFDPSTGALTLTGTLHATLTPGGAGSAAGSTMTVSLASLAEGIYDQGHEYDVAGGAGPEQRRLRQNLERPDGGVQLRLLGQFVRKWY
jgi:hypothetical protein